MQTGGRGRGSNRWWGGVGSLTFSIVFSPLDYEIELKHWPVMSLMIGLAIREALSSMFEQAVIQLKWPNDIYVNGKKICGILIETVPTDNRLVVIGIGLNVNNSFETAPVEIRCHATSIAEFIEHEVSREEVLIALLQSLELILSRFAAMPLGLLNEWKQHCWLTGKHILVDDAARQVTGLCQGIDDSGALVLLTESGCQRILTGSITVLELS